jgi:uncharacterized membrane protein YraQ (UPF0718 family)
MPDTTQSAVSATTPAAPSWFSFKHLTSAWWLVLIIPLGVLLVDPAQLKSIIGFASAAFLSTLPYIVFAVVLIAWLKAAGAEATIARAFEGREGRMIIFAALFGGLAPFCSCEVIPFVAGLLAVGTPLSAIMAFWLASPLIDPPSLLITAGALGWPFAIGKAASAVGLGLFGGLVVSRITAAGSFAKPARQVQAKSCCSTAKPTMTTPMWKFWPNAERRATFWQELIGNARFLVKWLVIAYLLEALLVTYIPASLIANFVGGEGIGPIVLAALVGMPAYLNSYIAPPLVAGLMEQGMSIGAAMAFMVAGAVSSIPAMAAVWSLVRTPVFFAYLGLGLLGAILSGQLMQWLL